MRVQNLKDTVPLSIKNLKSRLRKGITLPTIILYHLNQYFTFKNNAKNSLFFLASSGCSRNAIKNIITIQTIIFFHHKTICFLFLPKRQRYIMSGVQFVKENHPTSLYENAKKLKIKKSFQDSLYRT